MKAEALIEDYFRRDLGDEEEEALAQALQASPELAESFRAAAEEDARRWGSPDREERPSPWKPVLAVVLVTGACVWALSSPGRRPNVQVASVDETPYTEAVLPEKSLLVPKNSAAAKEARPVAELLVRAVAVPGYHFEAVLPGAAPDASLLVLDAGGALVRRLAPTRPGAWTWDGQDAQGRAVAAGLYRFEVAIGSQVRGQWVQIEERRR